MIRRRRILILVQIWMMNNASRMWVVIQMERSVAPQKTTSRTENWTIPPAFNVWICVLVLQVRLLQRTRLKFQSTLEIHVAEMTHHVLIQLLEMLHRMQIRQHYQSKFWTSQNDQIQIPVLCPLGNLENAHAI